MYKKELKLHALLDIVQNLFLKRLIPDERVYDNVTVFFVQIGRNRYRKC